MRLCSTQQCRPFSSGSSLFAKVLIFWYIDRAGLTVYVLFLQGIFQLTHPVHYLDSKFRGVGVAMTMKGLRTPSVARR